jgi:hypothetical protein
MELCCLLPTVEPGRAEDLEVKWIVLRADYRDTRYTAHTARRIRSRVVRGLGEADWWNVAHGICAAPS